MKRSSADLVVVLLQILSLLERSPVHNIGTTKLTIMDGLLHAFYDDEEISLKKASMLVGILLSSDLILSKVSNANYEMDRSTDGNDADAETDEEDSGKIGKTFSHI